ncbi:hypothetical protein [Candidatus Methylospira mobilis]|nr:hypothetical protein [Candidatus Methylospira mobilis]
MSSLESSMNPVRREVVAIGEETDIRQQYELDKDIRKNRAH